jgi:hypothetical protein
MMQHPSLSVIALVLALSANVSAQQRLVRHNDQDDPCRRFKMRILIPADVVDRELPIKRFAGGIDSKMVWNPCPRPLPQIAFAPFISPDRNDILFPKSTFSFRSGPAERPRKPEDLLAPPRFTFRRIWRRP